MGLLTNLVDQFFGNLQSGLSEEYQRQANKAGPHPITLKAEQDDAIRNYIRDEKRYLDNLFYNKDRAKEIEKLKKERLEYLVEHWGSAENYELFKKKIEEEETRKQNVDKAFLEEYNKRVQKDKEVFFKNHGIK
ncbi:MAG: hypothetical protein NT104_04720 [Bacteroidetes bacterium]|nr:hypothetical protein [Bacteroidota bacterium]